MGGGLGLERGFMPRFSGLCVGFGSGIFGYGAMGSECDCVSYRICMAFFSSFSLHLSYAHRLIILLLLYFLALSLRTGTHVFTSSPTF